jgi:hypothetical protein
VAFDDTCIINIVIVQELLDRPEPRIVYTSIFPEPDLKASDPDYYKDLTENGERFGLRGLFLTRGSKKDVFLTSPELITETDWLQEHARTVGIDTGLVVYSRDYARVIGGFHNHLLWPYSFGNEMHAIRPDERRLQATYELEDKNKFVFLAWERKFSIPYTVIYEDGKVFTPPGNGNYTDPAGPKFVKDRRSYNGKSVHEVANPLSPELQAAIDQVSNKYQVQDAVANADSLASIHFYIEEGKANLLAVTKQLVSEADQSHEGNSFPINPDLAASIQEAAQPVADKSAEMGIKGFIGLDVIVDKAGKVHILEVNARKTGATVSLFIATILGAPSYENHKMPTTLKSVRKLQKDLGGFAYKASEGEKSGSGAIINNPALAKTHGIFEVTIIGDEDERKEIKRGLDVLFRWEEYPMAISLNGIHNAINA